MWKPYIEWKKYERSNVCMCKCVCVCEHVWKLQSRIQYQSTMLATANAADEHCMTVGRKACHTSHITFVAANKFFAVLFLYHWLSGTIGWWRWCCTSCTVLYNNNYITIDLFILLSPSSFPHSQPNSRFIHCSSPYHTHTHRYGSNGCGWPHWTVAEG